MVWWNPPGGNPVDLSSDYLKDTFGGYENDVNRIFYDDPGYGGRKILKDMGMYGRGMGTPWAQYAAGTVAPAARQVYEMLMPTTEGNMPDMDFGSFLKGYMSDFSEGDGGMYIDYNELGDIFMNTLQGSGDNRLAQQFAMAGSNPQEQVAVLASLIEMAGPTSMSKGKQDMMLSSLYMIYDNFMDANLNNLESTTFGDYLMENLSDYIAIWWMGVAPDPGAVNKYSAYDNNVASASTRAGKNPSSTAAADQGLKERNGF